MTIRLADWENVARELQEEENNIKNLGKFHPQKILRLVCKGRKVMGIIFFI